MDIHSAPSYGIVLGTKNNQSPLREEVRYVEHEMISHNLLDDPDHEITTGPKRASPPRHCYIMVSRRLV